MDPLLAALALGAAGGAAWLLYEPSANFTWAELETTNTGLDNTPGFLERWNLLWLARELLEPVRAQFGPIHVDSAFRSPAVNAAVHGATDSYHLTGDAADIMALDGASNSEMAAWCFGNEALPIAECIVEHHTGHLHLARGSGRKFMQTSDGENYTSWTP